MREGRRERGAERERAGVGMLGGEGFGVGEEEVGAVQAAFERHDSPAEVRVVLLDLLQPERRKRRR